MGDIDFAHRRREHDPACPVRRRHGASSPKHGPDSCPPGCGDRRLHESRRRASHTDLAPSPTVFTEVGVRLEKDGPSIYGEAMFSPCRGCSLPAVAVTGDLVLRRQGHSARRAALDAQGQFDVPVAVGTYSVSVFVTAPTAGMRPVCPAPIHVRVAAEEAIHAWFTCA